MLVVTRLLFNVDIQLIDFSALQHTPIEFIRQRSSGCYSQNGPGWYENCFKASHAMVIVKKYTKIKIRYFPPFDFGVGSRFEMLGDSKGRMNGTCCLYVWISSSYFFCRIFSSLFASRRYRNVRLSHAIHAMGLSLVKVKPRAASIIPRYWGCLTFEYKPVVTNPFFRLVRNWMNAAKKMEKPAAKNVHPIMGLRLTL